MLEPADRFDMEFGLPAAILAVSLIPVDLATTTRAPNSITLGQLDLEVPIGFPSDYQRMTIKVERNIQIAFDPWPVTLAIAPPCDTLALARCPEKVSQH